ncbi:aldo/keto reductase [Jiella mangrovi]|uniref:Aldo/keto reductase n=1 Tax=Jiella mangrovi TaxID=2821407 RepID=A0ABS4BMY2_9HYPH|nr:aldo/keto reductase [Jiella mangrovi]MBP0618059.1 aldo/keto reductase [Jiella mangrovi]
MKTTSIGDTGLHVTELCFGTSVLGDMPDTYGYGVSEERAFATINAIFDGPANFLDTSRIYGFGRSEERIGKVIRERGGLPEGFVISTKLDRDFQTGRFDGDRVRQSFEESLSALGLDKIGILHLHDPEYAADLSEVTREGGAFDALFRLKEEGLVGAVGLAMGRLDLMFPLLRERPFDALISHNRFTLLNRSASQMFDYAHDKGIAILNAAPYAGGVLAKGSDVMKKVTYQDASEAELEPVRRVEEICSRLGVAPGAAALQFSMKDPRVTSTIVGVSKPERVAETLEWASAELPEALWQGLADMPFATDDPEANRRYEAG